MAIDIIFVITALYGFYVGYNRGIISTIFYFLTYVLGLIFAFRMSPLTTQVLTKVFNTDNPLMFLAGFLLNIVVIVIVMRQVSKGLTEGLQMAYLGQLNQILGGILTAGFSVLVYSVILYFLVQGRVFSPEVLAGSKTYEPVLKHLPPKAKVIADRLKPLAMDGWESFQNWMGKMENYGIERPTSNPVIKDLPDEEPTSTNPKQQKYKDETNGTGIETDPEE